MVGELTDKMIAVIENPDLEKATVKDKELIVAYWEDQLRNKDPNGAYYKSLELRIKRLKFLILLES